MLNRREIIIPIFLVIFIIADIFLTLYILKLSEDVKYWRDIAYSSYSLSLENNEVPFTTRDTDNYSTNVTITWLPSRAGNEVPFTTNSDNFSSSNVTITWLPSRAWSTNKWITENDTITTHTDANNKAGYGD